MTRRKVMRRKLPRKTRRTRRKRRRKTRKTNEFKRKILISKIESM